MHSWKRVIAATFGCLFLASSTCYGATIYACKKKVGGNVRIVTETKKCLKNEIKISWSDWTDFAALQTQDATQDMRLTALQTQDDSQESEIAALQTLTAGLAPASHQHDGRYYTEGEINAILAAPRARRVDVSVGALSVASDGTVITPSDAGYIWLNDYRQGASLNVQRPIDWDQTSPVVVRLFFMRAASAPGEVVFFVRPRRFNEGDSWADASGIPSTAPSVSGAVFQQLDISIPAAQLQKDWWSLSFQRDISTYPHAVILYSISIYYVGQGV